MGSVLEEIGTQRREPDPAVRNASGACHSSAHSFLINDRSQGDLIHSHGFEDHLYADDSEIFISSPEHSPECYICIFNCLPISPMSNRHL